MNQTLYISDLDGTLLNSGAALSEYAAASLRDMLSAGLFFTVATARTTASTLGILSALPPLPAPLVLMNGAVIWDQREERVAKKEIIPPPVLRELLRRVKAHGQQGFLYSLPERQIQVYHEPLVRPGLRDFYHTRKNAYGKHFIEVTDVAKYAENEIVYFTTQDSAENLSALFHEARQIPGIDCVLYPDTYVKDSAYLECYSDKASKKNAVRWLRETYGFGRVIGFGDNLNDLPMFETCDEAYAVANAHDAVKAAATGIIASHLEDGVVKYIMKAWNGDERTGI